METGRGGVGVVAFLTTVGWVGLLLAPTWAVRVWWGGVVPVLPALLLVAPRVWRNVCPVAALEIASGARFGRTLDVHGSVRMGGAGLLIFCVLVPARPLLFDHSALALAAGSALAALVAVVRGRTHAVRAGFCNSFCPLAGVERLYGLRAMVAPTPTHCPSCSACTRRGCPDLAGDKALRQLLGGGKGRVSWLRRPHGAFAAAMPGLVVGYALIGSAPSWSGAYGTVLGGGLASWLGVGAVSLAVPEASRRLPPALAALSALAFYQLLAPPALAAWDVTGLDAGVRWVGTGVVVAWAVRASRALGTSPARRPRTRSPGRSLPVLTTQPG